MEKKSTTVAQSEQGSDTPEVSRENLKRMLQFDLKTARCICFITGHDEDVANAVKVHLQKDIKSVPETVGIQKDAMISSSCLSIILENDLILEQIVDVMEGLQNNLINRRKLNQQKN